MKIVISARPYNPTVGGHIVLHKLCDSLLKQGLPAYLRPDSTKSWNINSSYLSQVTHEFDPENDVAIYHNSIRGNPWRAKKFIRWMLYLPWYETDGVVLYIHKMFGDGPILNVTEPFLDVFYDRGLPRQGVCWTWRKANKQGWKEKDRPKTGTEIPRGLLQSDLATIFNTHDRFVSYDGATYLSVLAALCGCNSIVMRPVDGERQLGLARNKQEVELARSEWPLLRSNMEREYQEQDVKAADVIRWAIQQF